MCLSVFSIYYQLIQYYYIVLFLPYISLILSYFSFHVLIKYFAIYLLYSQRGGNVIIFVITFCWIWIDMYWLFPIFFYNCCWVIITFMRSICRSIGSCLYKIFFIIWYPVVDIWIWLLLSNIKHIFPLVVQNLLSIMEGTLQNFK